MVAGRYAMLISRFQDIDIKTLKRKKMRYFFILIIVAVSLFSNSRPVMAKDIVFAPLPMELLEKVSSEFRPMLFYLEQQLNSSLTAA